MYDTLCPRCQEVGLVRFETVIKAGSGTNISTAVAATTHGGRLGYAIRLTLWIRPMTNRTLPARQEKTLEPNPVGIAPSPTGLFRLSRQESLA